MSRFQSLVLYPCFVFVISFLPAGLLAIAFGRLMFFLALVSLFFITVGPALYKESINPESQLGRWLFSLSPYSQGLLMVALSYAYSIGVAYLVCYNAPALRVTFQL